jgi:two-component system response regulator NreC
MFEDEQRVRQALQAGANAYIFKNCSPNELLETLSRTTDNETVVPKGYEYILEKEDELNLSKDPLTTLTKREQEIFFMLAEGLPNRIIAKKLIISARTVETHRARVIKKLELSSTADIVRYAIRNHLIVA